MKMTTVMATTKRRKNKCRGGEKLTLLRTLYIKESFRFVNKMTYYAIARGRKVGIFLDWNEAKRHVLGYIGARFRKFENLEEAKAFVDAGGGDDLRKANEVSIGYDTEPEDAYIVFTDGACTGNGKKGGESKGGYSTAWPFHKEQNGGWPLESESDDNGNVPTNNRAEFKGFIKACEIADTMDPFRLKKLIVYTDSMFLINCVTKWMSKWISNGFKKSDGSDVLNQDLLLIIHDLMKKRDILLYHVRAHTGRGDWASKWNDEADKLARVGASRYGLTFALSSTS